MAPRRSQDSVSNAGRTSSLLRQAAANKAASDARKQFREKRHRAELDKLKAGQALETVKDKEEDTANETWSMHPLEWMNERHVARCGTEGKDWYIEKWLMECNQNQSDNVPDQKARKEYNDGMTNAEGQSGDCAMTDDDEDDDSDDDSDDKDDDSDEENNDDEEEGSDDSNEEDDDEDDDSDEEDNDEDENDSEEKEIPKAKKQRPMEKGKIEQKMKKTKSQRPMGKGKIEQKMKTAKRQKPMGNGEIKQKMKKVKKEEHSDEEHEDEEFEDKESEEDIVPTDRPPDANILKNIKRQENAR